MSDTWQMRARPARLERRVEFSDYQATSNFLARLGDLSEREKAFPNLSFGRTYVNITLHGAEGAADVDDGTWRMARLIDELAGAAPRSG